MMMLQQTTLPMSAEAHMPLAASCSVQIETKTLPRTRNGLDAFRNHWTRSKKFGF